MIENKITIKNLIYSLIFLVLGIFLINSNEDIITIISKILGCVIATLGIVQSIVYVYLKGKLGDYDISNLIRGLLLISLGVLLILSSYTFSFIIRNIIGLWIIFSSINRLIFSLSIKTFDFKGFIVYLITSLLMFIIGVLLISNMLDKIIGWLIIIYSIIEIVDYIYYNVKDKDFKPVKKEKKSKKKLLKKGKIVDAIIEEEKTKK